MSTNKIKAKKDFLLVGILPSLKFSLLHCHSFWTRKKAFNVNKVWIFFPHSKQHETLKSNLWMWLKVFIQLTQKFYWLRGILSYKKSVARRNIQTAHVQTVRKPAISKSFNSDPKLCHVWHKVWPKLPPWGISCPKRFRKKKVHRMSCHLN